MSSFAASAQGKIKEVLRIAMIGIQPGDQVMIKGYLRVLLRLEVDLEWVAANSPNVDLFVINNQFQAADSVIKLLEANSNVPVLYVTRGSDESGGFHDNIITLPLKKLHDLNDWLFNRVIVLSDNKAAHRRIINDAELNIENTAAQQSKSNQTAQTDAKSQNESLSNNEKSDNDENKTDFLNRQGDLLLKFVVKLELREDKYYELWIKDGFVGIIHSKSECIWLSNNAGDNTFAPDGSWELRETQRQPTDKNKFQDLVQWLWLQAFLEPDALLPLLSPEREFRLHFWMKPQKDDSRREVIRLFTALETQPRTLMQLSDITETSKEMASRTLAGLLFSGGLEPSIHKVLKADIDAYNKAISKNAATEIPSAVAVSSNRSIDEILARREAGEVAAPIPSSYDISHKPRTKPVSESTTEQTSAAKPEPKPTTKKRGFLAKLRDKLGI